MKLLIFTSDIHQSCNSYYLVKNQEDEDNAAYDYLKEIGDFSIIEDTAKTF